MVVFHHMSLIWFSWDLHLGPGVDDGQVDNWLSIFLKLPIARLLISGPPAVAIFFVVSGYAISHKSLKLARQGRFAELGSTLSSSVSRRHARLYLPAAIITFCSALATQWHPGWFGRSGVEGVAVPIKPVPQMNNLVNQLRHFAYDQMRYTLPISQGFLQGSHSNVLHSSYDNNLWTLPIEFTSSMVVFLFLAATTRLQNRVRMVLTLVALLYFMYFFAFWAMFLFLSGMVICDLRLEMDQNLATASRSAENGPESCNTTILPIWACDDRHVNLVPYVLDRVKRLWGAGLHLTTLICALWFLSTPEEDMGATESWGYVTLTSTMRNAYGKDFLVPLGAVMLVLVVDQAKFLQILFSNAYSQYLGRISYSLYLVHGPLLYSMGLKLGLFMIGITGGSELGYCIGVFIAMALWLPFTIYVADLTARCIDEQCLQFTRWIYAKLSKKME